MTWAELTALNNGGNEIGGHTVDHVNLKALHRQRPPTYEVCQDRQNLIDHGFYPTSFAYPNGAYDATAESIVQGCGYTSGRAAGGIDVAGDGAGPVYAETTPPKDPFATRTVYDAPSGQPAERPAAARWPTCEPRSPPPRRTAAAGSSSSSTRSARRHYDPANYSFCISDWGPVELNTLNALLDWLQNAGQPGGAPPRTDVQTVSQVVNGPDTQAPVTTLNCDGSPCASTTYNGSTTVALSAKDPGGSGVQATYYTTDGSTPTTSSPRLHRPVHDHPDHHLQVLLGRQLRQHRGGADPAGPGAAERRPGHRRGR